MRSARKVGASFSVCAAFRLMPMETAVAAETMEITVSKLNV
jgi:hypothetical protein